jgi:hypothetical protein
MDLYLIHTPFALQPGDNMDPRDEAGNGTSTATTKARWLPVSNLRRGHY